MQVDISQLNSKLNNLAVSHGEGENVSLHTDLLSAGREISDVYLAPMADEMSDDSEGDEVPALNVNGKYLPLGYVQHLHRNFYITNLF